MYIAYTKIKVYKRRNNNSLEKTSKRYFSLNTKYTLKHIIIYAVKL